jgi:hypothetical protein
VRSRRHRRRDGGMLLGIVLILLGVVLLAGALALSSVRSDTASAGADRLSRQLENCAEEGLEYGKNFFGTADWSQYLPASNVCNSTYGLSCPPLRAGSGTAPANYPVQSGVGGVPAITMGNQSLQFTVAIYDNDETGETAGADYGKYIVGQDYSVDTDGVVVVYSRCVETTTHQSKAVQAVIRSTVPTNIDYAGQAGFGFRNQGNQN